MKMFRNINLNQSPPDTDSGAKPRDDGAPVRPGALSLSPELLEKSSPLMQLFESTLDIMLIVNEQRQVVRASSNMLALVDASDVDSVLGMRPGDIFGCIHARSCAGGCGTTEACRECGAVKAIFSALAGEPALAECRLTRRGEFRHESFDLRVKSTPAVLDGRRHAILAVSDISSEKRRQNLENVFLQDLMREVFSLEDQAGRLRRLLDESPEMSDKTISLLGHIARLNERILYQHDLAEAERNELTASFIRMKPGDFLHTLVSQYEETAMKRGVLLNIDPRSSDEKFHSDRILLQRVLGSLVMNAVEAVQVGEDITIGAKNNGANLVFWVNNPGELPDSVRLQVFNRSFSTKSPSRGLGTYTARLLTEQYLFGKISFLSDKKTGTTFCVEIPFVPPNCFEEDEADDGAAA